MDWVTHMRPRSPGKGDRGQGGLWARGQVPDGGVTASAGWMATKSSSLARSLGSGRMGRQAWLLRIYKDVQRFTPQSNSRGQHPHPRAPRGRALPEPSSRRRAQTAPRLLALRAGAQVTWVVPAAARGAPPPPGAVVEGGVPLAEPPALQGVRGQVADLQAGELAHEVSE